MVAKNFAFDVDMRFTGKSKQDDMRSFPHEPLAIELGLNAKTARTASA